MPRFLITRTIPPLTQEELNAAGKIAYDAAVEMGLRYIKSYYSEKDRKLYCEYEAPDIEAIYEHARRAQIPVDSVSLISAEFDSSMFK